MKYIFFLLLIMLAIAVGVLAFRHFNSTALVTTGSGGCVDIAASPDYLSSGDPHDAVAAINNAHTVEHLPPLRLSANFYQLNPAQQQFILVNIERTDRGLRPLRMDPNLGQMAWGYSKQLFNLHFFAHTSPISGTFSDRMNGNPATANHYSQAAENLAGNPVAGIGSIYEYMYDDSAEACGHRLNILDPDLTLIGINWLRGSIYGSISAQEFLTPASWNPYVGSTPDGNAPKVHILVSTAVAGSTTLQCQAVVQDSKGIERISWFLDSLSNPLSTGSSLTLDIRKLSPGRHTLLVYVVGGEQNYASASYTIVI
jgi:uncharacterized protein YkwD